MQINFAAAIFLFLGSYFPLSLILAVQDVKATSWAQPLCSSIVFWSKCSLPSLENPGIAWTLLGVSALSLIFFLYALRYFGGQHEMEIEESKTIPNDLINYVFPYVVSFMGLDLGSTGKTLGFILFLAWMFLISYRSGQILMNPLLLVAGWQLYEIRADIEGNKRQLRALSRQPVHPKQRLSSCFIQGIYVLSKPK
ncbi:hypothetical protein M2282_003569 [Variovorax boronicumulans]|uniref:hypothetical protein n=1 Tax=Variovorax boronicumulans TaxID=436515 RepID=UPI0024734CD4|nr:hypothetical protein [Variovorax boronicumulans]MDH6168416.1 hypothetical protein [Variovorax boronicumulans]